MRESRWPKRNLMVVLALFTILIGMTFLVSASSAAHVNLDLSNLFSTEKRIFLLDTNGDGFTDALNTFIVLPEDPTAAQSAAAANIGARLGFETMGMDLPLAITEGRGWPWDLNHHMFVKGRKAEHLHKELHYPIIIKGHRAKHLLPGQGIIESNAWSKDPAVEIWARDEAGTLAVGDYFAGRLPYIWQVGQGNLTLGDVKAAVTNFLGYGPENALVTGIVCEAGKGGLAQVWVGIAVSDWGQFEGVVKALKQLAAAHERGEQWDKLNFERIAELVVEIKHKGMERAIFIPNKGGIPVSPPSTPLTADASDYDLSSLFGNFDELGQVISGTLVMQKTEGLLGDTPERKPFLEKVGVLKDPVKDFIPDTTKATLIAAGKDGEAAIGAANFAARLGLETTGINLPLARTPEQISDASKVVNPVLFGASNPFVQQLDSAGKVGLHGLDRKQGMVSVIPKAFGSHNALVVAGKDHKGMAAAADYAARRLPYLWETQRGYTTMADIEDAVKNFFSVKSAGGQAAEALLKIDELKSSLSGDLTVYLDLPLGVHTDQAFANFLKKRVKGATNVAVKAMKDPSNVFTYEWTDKGEMAEFREIYGTVTGSIGNGTGVEIEVRLSEPPAVLDALQAELQAKAPNAKVTVISAYKQGFSWLSRVVTPALQGKKVDKVTISFQEFYQDGVNASNWKVWNSTWGAADSALTWMDLPTRWLHEIYPIDDFWQMTLGFSRDKVVCEQVKKTSPNTPLTGPTYMVNVTFSDGTPPYQAGFTPTYDERDYHLGTKVKNFKVHPTTGWVQVTKGGATLVSQRIKTDPERYWDYFQGTVWPAVRDYVLSLTDNDPTDLKQPFFKEFKHEVWMSEANYRLGVRQENISSLESLYEDIYFVNLDYFSELRGVTYPNRNTAPGKIAPWMHDGEPGSAPRAVVSLDALNSKVPRVVVRVDGVTKFDIPLTGASVQRPKAMKAIVHDDAHELAQLKVDVLAADAAAQTKALDMLHALRELHTGHALTDQLSWARLGELEVEVSGPSLPQSILLAKSTHVPSRKVIGPTTGVTLPTTGSIVQWKEPIGYEETNAILAQLDKTPEINVWLGGKSYEGRSIFVADVMLPVDTELWSQAKATNWKPTYYLVDRQHANEVASTNQGLRLIEMMSKDPLFREYLKGVNVVIVPYWNADGATFSYELQLQQPNWMHHAGRYNAAGTDVPNHAFNPVTPWTEAPVVTKVWQTWLPDEYFNHHGYPHHEWVQQFAGYTPPAYLSYWIARGHYFSNSTMGYRDPATNTTKPIPEGKAVSDAIKNQLYAQVHAQPDIMEFNQNVYAQYDKYGAKWWPNVFRTEYMGPPGELLMMYTSTSRVNPFGNSYTSGYPWITWGATGGEVMDEIPHGDFMDMCARAHMAPDLGTLDVYYYANPNLGRSETELSGNVYLREFRIRPVTPATP